MRHYSRFLPALTGFLIFTGCQSQRTEVASVPTAAAKPTPLPTAVSVAPPAPVPQMMTETTPIPRVANKNSSPTPVVSGEYSYVVRNLASDIRNANSAAQMFRIRLFIDGEIERNGRTLLTMNARNARGIRSVQAMRGAFGALRRAVLYRQQGDHANESKEIDNALVFGRQADSFLAANR